MAQINKPSDYFNTVTYTGDDATPTRTITGVGFQPDLVWVKRRSNSGSHYIWDVARGTNLNIFSNHTLAELNINTGDPNGGVSTSSSDGFTVIEGTSDIYALNQGGETHVSWNWLGGGTASSNTDGSITSQVSANTTSGFSIVSYTGTGANATVGHGLGVAPKMVIFKNRDNGTQEWDTYHTGLTDATYFIQLNSTNAQNNTNGALRFNSTAPSTNYFSVGTATTTNESGNAMIAYCFAEKKGFSKFGKYTGNGSTNGTFVYTGFKPAFLIQKRTDAGSSFWSMWDSVRNTYNNVTNAVNANVSDREYTAADGILGFDFLSNGFKVRDTNSSRNASGGTYIYMAFAENPFVTSTGVPATAR